MEKKLDIKLIALDVDGVLTDGKLLIGSDGVEYKSFNVKDGMGISLARHYGMQISVISGRKSESVQIRSKELNIDYLYEGIVNKVDVLYELVELLDIQLSNVFYMGDDINDLPIIKLVGFSAAPKDAVEIVKESVDFVSNYNGGDGAVREAIEYVLSQEADFQMLVKNYQNIGISVSQQ